MRFAPAALSCLGVGGKQVGALPTGCFLSWSPAKERKVDTEPCFYSQ